jgi:hypothetical protein
MAFLLSRKFRQQSRRPRRGNRQLCPVAPAGTIVGQTRPTTAPSGLGRSSNEVANFIFTSPFVALSGTRGSD